MRVRATAAVAVVLLAALTACGSGEAVGKPPAVEAPSEQSTPGTVEKTLKLGEPARTVGGGGTGVLEVTPDTVVFVKEASGETSENGVFVVVTMKDRAVTAVAADESAPAAGGGWKWLTADGEMVDSGGGNAFNIVIGKYNNAGPVQPGSYQWRLRAFDLTEKQAQGGTLVYVDGEGKVHRWQMPSTDSGPNVAEVKKQLEF